MSRTSTPASWKVSSWHSDMLGYALWVTQNQAKLKQVIESQLLRNQCLECFISVPKSWPKQISSLFFERLVQRQKQVLVNLNTLNSKIIPTSYQKKSKWFGILLNCLSMLIPDHSPQFCRVLGLGFLLHLHRARCWCRYRRCHRGCRSHGLSLWLWQWHRCRSRRLRLGLGIALGYGLQGKQGKNIFW